MIRQLPSGRYQVRYSATLGGKRKHFRFTATTKREAEAELRRRLTKLEEDGWIEPSKLTLEAFSRRWLDHQRDRVRESTWRKHEVNWRRHILPVLGSMKLRDLRRATCVDFEAKLAATALAPQSRKHVHDTLRWALAAAVDWELLPRNPMANIAAPKVPRSERGALTLEQYRALSALTPETPHGLMLQVLVDTGLRIGELLGLRWRDYDADRGELTVAQQRQRFTGRTVFSAPKTERSRRTVVLPASLVAWLRRHRAEQNAARLEAGPYWEDNDLVFANGLGRAWHYIVPRRAWLKVRAALGLPEGMTLHDLRHSHATLGLVMGETIGVVSERLGHSDKAYTWKRYGHVLPGAQRDLARKFDQLKEAAEAH